MYGETTSAPVYADRDKGLSPRVRGNHVDRLGMILGVGSIPACTGKPLCSPLASATTGVYPRVYGETCHRRP